MPDLPHKIVVVGSGDIGKDLIALLHKQYPHENLVLENRESERAIGAAISLDQAQGIARKLRRGGLPEDAKVVPYIKNNVKEAMRDADIVIVTAGVPRKSKDQSRTDLAADNISLIDPIAKAAAELQAENPNKKTTYVIATNPIGLIDQRFQEVSSVPHEQIIGLSGELDVERLRQSIRLHLNVGYNDIRGERVLGDHGPNMVPLLSQIEIRKNGQWQKMTELPEFKQNEAAILTEFNEATTKGGGKFVKWTGKSDGTAPAVALAYMVEQIYDARFGDKSASLPVTGSTFLPDAGIYSGQTVKFNEDGTHSPEKMLEISSKEKNDLQASIAGARKDKQAFETLVTRLKETGLSAGGNQVD